MSSFPLHRGYVLALVIVVILIFGGNGFLIQRILIAKIILGFREKERRKNESRNARLEPELHDGIGTKAERIKIDGTAIFLRSGALQLGGATGKCSLFSNCHQFQFQKKY